MNVYEKLQHVQSGLKAPKNQYNKFGNYHYRNCEDIQEAAKPLLQEVKAALVVGDELVMIGERYYIRATARFVDCESGETVENTAYAREEQEKKGMDVSQVTGSTSSYARKYALNGLFCIDDVKDADNQDNTAGKAQAAGKGTRDNTKPAGKTKAGKGTDVGAGQTTAPAEEGDKAAPTGAGMVTKAMIASITSLIEKYSSKGLKMEKILKMYQIKDIVEMTVDQYRDCMDKLNLYEKADKEGAA